MPIPKYPPPAASVNPSIPSALPQRPVYSTSEFSQRRNTPPPPPPVSVRESGVRERNRKRRGRRQAEWAWVIVAAALFGVFILMGMSALLLVRASQNTQEVLPTADVALALPTAVVARANFSNGDLGDTLALPDGSLIELKPWDGASRFTMILAGLDRRPGERGIAYRTDTMMLVSLDPVSQSLGILSIPRDLYVQVPGFSALQRINTPMVYGENQQPGFGPTLTMQTVQLNLGMRVNDYMLVDFQAFINLVDAIGGISVTTD